MSVSPLFIFFTSLKLTQDYYGTAEKPLIKKIVGPIGTEEEGKSKKSSRNFGHLVLITLALASGITLMVLIGGN